MENKEKKFSFRYRTVYFLILILSLSFLATFFTLRKEKKVSEDKLSKFLKYIIVEQLNDELRSALYQNGYHSKYEKNYISYIFNKNITKESLSKDELKYSQGIQIGKNLSTNIKGIKIDNNFMPSKDFAFAVDSKDVVWVKGNVLEKRIESNKDSFLGTKADLAKYFVEAAKSEAEAYMHGKDFDYFMSINLSDKNFIDEAMGRYYFEYFALRAFYVVIGLCLLFLLIASFTSYKNLREMGGLDFVVKIPIEIYVAFFFLVSYALEGIFRLSFSQDLYTIFFENIKYLYPALFIGIFVMAMYAFYVVLFFKSVYFEGVNNFLFKNSIIIRLFRWVFKIIKICFSKFIDFIEIFRGLRLFLLGLFIFVIILFSGSIVNALIIMLASLILLVYIYRASRDFNKIEKNLESIAEGDYSQKLEIKNSRYKNMADSINSMSNSMGLALERQLKSERMKNELITNVSHDLKTPLTSIINYSELIVSKDIRNEDREKYSYIINEKAQKLKILIENLFELSKLNSNNVKFEKINFNFNEMLKQLMGEWDDKFREKNLEFIYKENKAAFIKLDPNQSSRILDNLFSNIYKYAMENTRVYVDLEVDEKVRLVIKNISKYPLNISPDELIERFTRGDRARVTEGSGLGLSIASNLTKLQGGQFNIDILGDVFTVEIIF